MEQENEEEEIDLDTNVIGDIAKESRNKERQVKKKKRERAKKK